MHFIRHNAAAWFVAIALGGCSLASLQADKREITRYGLNPQIAAATQEAGIDEGKIIRLSAITAAPGADSRYMAYSMSPGQIAYFAHNEWLDRPARLLEPLIVEALEGRDGIRAVLSREVGAHPDLRLDLTLERLVHRFDTEPSQVELSLRARLLSVPGGRLLLNRRFNVSAPAPSADPAGGVQATDAALTQVLGELQRAVAAAVERD